MAAPPHLTLGPLPTIRVKKTRTKREDKERQRGERGGNKKKRNPSISPRFVSTIFLVIFSLPVPLPGARSFISFDDSANDRSLEHKLYSNSSFIIFSYPMVYLFRLATLPSVLGQFHLSSPANNNDNHNQPLYFFPLAFTISKWYAFGWIRNEGKSIVLHFPKCYQLHERMGFWNIISSQTTYHSTREIRFDFGQYS